MSRVKLNVQIEIDGQFVQAGYITGSSFIDAVFSYDDSYLSSKYNRAISLSLPLSKKDFDADETKTFFDGLKTPYRLHQEDFAQALGIKSSDKYEKNNQGYLKRMFNLLQKYSSNPIEDILKLWRRTIFNYLIGNTDNHIKNSSLVYSKNLSSIRLAPFYDVICTRIYPTSTDEMSVSINGKQNINHIARDDFEKEAKNCGLGPKIAMKIYDQVHDGIRKALLDSADELSKTGFTEACTMADKIVGKFL